MITTLEITNKAKNDIKKLEKAGLNHILRKLELWIMAVELVGIEKVRLTKSYHDEPLKGERFGQRSIRLNKDYRAIYSIKKGKIEFISLEEVNKHDY